jgi:Uma2 family endonuclease
LIIMSVSEIQAPRVIGPKCNGMLMTIGEFLEADDWEDGWRYELVHGVLIVNPAPGGGERRPNDQLGHWFLTYQESHPQGAVLDDTVGEHDIITGTGVRRADRVVWANLGRFPDYRADVPTIAIEFTSDRSRDRPRDLIEKRREYAAAGVREYWVIDRFRRRMTVFRGADEIIVNENEVYATPLLPGFELPLAQLLAIADRFPE